MKTYREQLMWCRENGMTGKGPFLTFAQNPGLLPFNPRIAKKFKKSGIKGLQTVSCLKFGGQCSSGNPQCRAMRGVEPKAAPEARFTRGTSTFDGQKCDAWFNVSNWP